MKVFELKWILDDIKDENLLNMDIVMFDDHFENYEPVYECDIEDNMLKMHCWRA